MHVVIPFYCFKSPVKSHLIRKYSQYLQSKMLISSLFYKMLLASHQTKAYQHYYSATTMFNHGVRFFSHEFSCRPKRSIFILSDQTLPHVCCVLYVVYGKLSFFFSKNIPSRPDVWSARLIGVHSPESST